MIVDRDNVLKVVRQAPPAGYKTHELAAAMGADQKDRHRLRKLLADLVEEGALEKAPGARYRLFGVVDAAAARGPRPGAAGAPGAAGPAGVADASGATEAPLPPGLVAGSLRVHPAGYGFVVRDDAEDDVYVGARNRGAALDGDRVAVSTWIGYKGTEGRVERVLARGRAKLTGILHIDSHGGGKRAFLEPDDPRIAATGGQQVLLDDGAAGGREGQAVVAEITRYPAHADEPLRARILKILGDLDDPRTEVEKILIVSDIPQEFPADVAAAGARSPTEVAPEDLADRVDLRDREFLTIDPETARDFDDAVCVEKSPRQGCTRLWVAVADVSHYVRPGSAIDREARIRGCSVYLPDRAIPMLPEELSSGMCSLNPEVDRLAMVARMEVDKNGDVFDPYFCAAVIRSRARLDYPGVAAALAGDLRGSRARYQPYLPSLKTMDELAGRLRKKRSARGSLDFDIPEPKVLLDEDNPRLVRDVVKSRANPEIKGAYQLIEDCMLAANESVARHFRDREMDTVWRVHDVPSDERLNAFAGVAESLGFKFDPEEGKSPRKLRAFLESMKGRPMERALNFLLLRALKQAVYDVVNLGHFGLAAPDYVHFTSPIRRYPDLIVHRLLKSSLAEQGLPAGGPPPTRAARLTLQEMAAASSKNERRAMEAEREVVDMYRAFLMRDRVGEEYDGTIAGVAAFGFFVQVEAPFIEGLVKTQSLNDDSYELDEHGMRLHGRRTGRTFALGDAVRVRIENVSVQRRKIDMVLAEHVARDDHRHSLASGARKVARADGDMPPQPRKGHVVAERPKGRKRPELPRGGDDRRRKSSSGGAKKPGRRPPRR